MLTNEIINAEVLFIINQFPISYKNKIPKFLIEDLYNNLSKNRFEELDPNKTFFNQNISEEALDIVRNLISIYFV